MLLLALSSLMFIAPSVLAYRRKKKTTSFLCCCLTTTSLLYHGIGRNWMQVLDIAFVHILVSCYTLKGLYLCYKTRKPICFTGCINSLISIGIYTTNCAYIHYHPLQLFVQLNGCNALISYIFSDT